MSDQNTSRGTGGQSATLYPSTVSTIKALAYSSLAISIVAFLVAGVLYVRVKSVVLDHTDDLAQKIVTVEDNSHKAIERMANMNSELNALKEELGKLEATIPGVVQDKMTGHALSEMQHKAGFLAASIEDDAKREKVAKIMALLAELQGKEPPKKDTTDAQKPAADEAAPDDSAKKEAAAETPEAEEPAADAAAEAGAEEHGAETGEPKAEVVPAGNGAAAVTEESMGLPPTSHELAKAEEYATGGEPPKKAEAKSDEKQAAAAGDDLDAKAEADAYAVDEQAGKMLDKAVDHLEEGAKKLEQAITGDDASKEQTAKEQQAAPAEADDKAGSEKKDEAAAPDSGSQLDAKAEADAYAVDAEAEKVIPQDVHKLMGHLEDTFGKLEAFITGDDAAKKDPAKKETEQPAAKPEAADDATAAPESKTPKGGATAVDPLVEQLQNMNLQPMAAPAAD